MIILKKGQSDPKIEDDTAQSLQCFISQLNSEGAFFGLWQGDLVTVGPVRNPTTTFYAKQKEETEFQMNHLNTM